MIIVLAFHKSVNSMFDKKKKCVSYGGIIVGYLSHFSGWVKVLFIYIFFYVLIVSSLLLYCFGLYSVKLGLLYIQLE